MKDFPRIPPRPRLVPPAYPFSMKKSPRIAPPIALPLMALGLLGSTHGADRFWDGTAGNIVTDGNGVSTYAAGTWNTTLTNWDAGAAPHVAWNNANVDTAIFGGTYSAGTKLVTLGSSVTVNQIKILTGDSASATSGNRYDIGSTADAVNAITFGGTYSTSNPSIDASGTFVRNTQFAAKITGTINGGLVVAHGSDGTNPGSGRLLFGNAANDFTGDVTLLSGNTHVVSNFGNAANKIVLHGGSIFGSSATAITYNLARNISVSANSGINLNATGSAAIVMDLQGALTGASNLTRYSGANVNADVRFSGDLSGFTGTIENTGAGIMTIQSTATSGGGWKVSGGTLRLNTTDDTHIANGAGKADLQMNGGTLNMNGKSETINGLAGAAGTVQNALAATTSTLTVGDGDATATFGGTLRNNAGTGGTLALVKTGDGIQTLSGNSTYTGDTLVTAGTLLITGQLGATAVTVEGTAIIGGDGIIGGTLHFEAGAKLVFDVGQTLTLNGAAVTFEDFGVDDLTGLDSSVANGNYLLIDGSATVSTANLAHLGAANAYDLGDGKAAYFETGSLHLVVVPEPSAMLLGSFGLLGLLRRRRA